MTLGPFAVQGADGKLIRGDRADGCGRSVLFITGLLSKRWGNKSKALAQWSAEAGWGFCCYDVRGFGDSEGKFSDYTLSDWIADARSVVGMLTFPGQTTRPSDASSPDEAPLPADAALPALTIVGNSLGGWIAWLIAQEHHQVDRLILIAPAFNMMGVRANSISSERRHVWQRTGWMPWDDDPVHREWPLSWRWVEESESYWASSFSGLRRVRTTILHGTEDHVILPEGSREFVRLLRRQDPFFPVDLRMVPGDHRLSSPEHMELLRQLLLEPV